MVSEVIVVNEGDFEKKKKAIIADGPSKFHVVSDFDRTITYGLDNNGERTPTVISQLRSDPKYLGDDYQKKANELFDIYHPIEIDPNISLEEKQKKMYEWWTKHFNFITQSGLSKSLISKVIKEKPLKFREGSHEFFSTLDKFNVPLVFMSASTGDLLEEYLKQNDLMTEDVYVVANRYKFNEKGIALEVQEPIIHTFNKTEVALKDHPIFQKIKDRTNVLLMGDSLGDVGMIKGFDYKNLIKIGFLNENIDTSLESYKKNFDVVITHDGSIDYVNKLIGEILK